MFVDFPLTIEKRSRKKTEILSIICKNRHIAVFSKVLYISVILNLVTEARVNSIHEIITRLKKLF